MRRRSRASGVLPDPEPPALPPPTPANDPRWSYARSAAYRLTGDNPFAAPGYCAALFGLLRHRYGRLAFTRADVGRAIEKLRRKGVVRRALSELAVAVEFISTAGSAGALAMV